MREHEMRLRVFRFLKARMRNMLMPATVGIGLAVGGCAKEGALPESPDSAADTAKDGFQGIPIYSATFPDGSVSMVSDAPGSAPDLATNAAEVSAQADAVADVSRDAFPDSGPDAAPPDLRKADGADALAADVAPPTDQVVALDGGGIDAGKADTLVRDDAGLDAIGAKYIAPQPDTAPDLGPVTKYLAQVPDAGPEAGRIVPDYIAQSPDAGMVAPVYTAMMPS